MTASTTTTVRVPGMWRLRIDDYLRCETATSDPVDWDTCMQGLRSLSARAYQIHMGEGSYDIRYGHQIRPHRRLVRVVPSLADVARVRRYRVRIEEVDTMSDEEPDDPHPHPHRCP